MTTLVTLNYQEWPRQRNSAISCTSPSEVQRREQGSEIDTELCVQK